MKGKPFLVAVAAFVVVLFGGVAIAGVGSFAGFRGGDTAAQVPAFIEKPAADEPVKDEPAEAQPVKEEPKDEKPVKEVPKDEKPVKEVPKDEKPVKEVPKDEKPVKEVPKDEKPVKEVPKDEEPVKEEPKDEEPVKDVPKDLFSITKPKEGSHLEKKVVRFAGEAIDGVTVHRGKYKTESKGGEWAMELVLSPGTNKVTFEAVHTSGKTESETVTVYYDAPIEEEPKAEEPNNVDFTAEQKYGSCGEEVPYDVFWGTTEPGATIKVKSAYGYGATEANEKGHWEIKVKFPDSKPGDTFEVKVISSAGGSKTFTFTNTHGKGGDN